MKRMQQFVSCSNYFRLSANPSSCLQFNYTFSILKPLVPKQEALVLLTQKVRGWGRIHIFDVRPKKIYPTLP